MRKKTEEEFINDCKLLHDEKYLYNNVNYVNGRVKVLIECKEHGFFEQEPRKHLSGSICPLCANENRSEKMKNNFERGIINGWAHINEKKDRRSYPEEFFIKVFENNNLYEKYTILEKYSYGKYFTDFLFTEVKLIVEIDGEQHFRNEESINHDLIRDEYFLREGFKIYRIRWRDVCNNSKFEINEFIEFLNKIESKIIRKYDINDSVYEKKKKVKKKVRKLKNIKLKNKLIKTKNNCINCGCLIYGEKFCSSCYGKSRRIIERPATEQLLLEVNDIGYSAVGRKYGVSDNAIRKWLKNGSLV